MSKKKKIILFSVIGTAVLIFIAVIVTIIILANRKPKPVSFSGDIDETTDVIIIDDEDEIKSIDDYTVKEVLGIALGKVTTCTAFEVRTTGTSTASIATIKISNHRIIKNNEAFIECISESNMGIGTAGSQRFFSGDNVCIRNTNTVKDLKPDYKDKETNVINQEQYKEKYGWLPYQMNGYIISQETYLEDPTMTKNNDNTYTILVKLDPDSNAAFYYKREVATNANATKEPVFKEIQFEIKIDSNFVITEVKTHEKYDVTVNFIFEMTQETVTECVDTYNYNNVSFDETLYNYYKGKLSA